MDSATDESPETGEVEGPLEDALAVLRERIPSDRTLLDPAELDREEPGDAERTELEDEDERLRAEEAARIVAPPPDLPPDSLTPELLEDVLEPDVVPAEAVLHEEDPLLAALLDEGVELADFDEEAVEYELERREAEED